MSDDAAGNGGAALRFSRFTLLPQRQLLLDGDQPVRLGSRPMAILTLLVQRAGELVTKNEILAYAWPNISVDEGALRVHMATLRKILGGDGFISNVVGRGYQFVHPVTSGVAQPAAASAGPVTLLPSAPGTVFGRDSATAELGATLAVRRLVTVTGPGGIGKTTVALATARALEPAYRDGSRFIDLAPLVDPRLVAGTLASALGLPVAADPLPAITAYLKSRRLLLVFDNCEQVIEAAAALVEHVLHTAPGIDVLATSREPLRAENEWVHRLEGLAQPPSDVPLTLAGALVYPAAGLFISRARASQNTLVLTDADADAIGDICRRLDGVPLALELAAARVALFGISGLAARLDDRFAVLTKGRRTALPRQQTLKATLDWSHDLLTEDEKGALADLSIFRGRFGLDEATAIGRLRSHTDAALLDLLDSLVAKSLLVVEQLSDLTLYRMLEITREYAAGKLDASGRRQALARVHARHFADVFAAAQSAWDVEHAIAWKEAHAHQIGDLRAAIDWCYELDGDPLTGARLVLASAPLWMELALLGEFQKRAELALSEAQAGRPTDKSFVMRLSTLLGHIIYETGMTPAGHEALSHAVALAEELGDVRQKLAALMALYVERGASGEYSTTRKLAEIVGDVAAQAGFPDADLLRERYRTLAFHLGGNQIEASETAARVFAHPGLHVRRAPMSGFEFDPLLSAHAVRARTNWMRGYADQAAAEIKEALITADAFNHMPTYYFLMTLSAGPISLWIGDVEWSNELLAEVRDRPLVKKEGGGLLPQEHWTNWEKLFQMARDACFGLAPLDYTGAMFAAKEARIVPYSREVCASAHETLAGPWVNERVDAGQSGWVAPEVLRGRGLILLHNEPDRTAEAEAWFRRALSLAERQGALAWGLRSATSLARLHAVADKPSEARAALEPVYARFTEGFETRDLLTARDLLAAL
jgi:predicted ATPase/DNA-binding winged helix-turn-helix (wHTH) protein